MIDEKKQQKKAEMNRQEEETQSQNQGDERLEASSTAQQSNATGELGNENDEMIDDDDGYVIQDGNLMKDGILVANGAVFETGLSLEDGRQEEDRARDGSNGNGEDANMILDDDKHVAADETVVDSGTMLWER